MKIFPQSLLPILVLRSAQFVGIFALAMFLAGPKARGEFFEMTADLTKVSSRVEFAEWMVRSQFRVIELTKIEWKPVSVFPKEAEKFK